MTTLHQLVAATRERARRVEAHGAAYMRWLPPQWAFLHDPSRIKLLRLGNQWGGKTTAGLTEIDWRCTGKHPFLTTAPPPIEAWVVCESWSQSVAIQEKFWRQCDHAEIDTDRTLYNPGKGFRGKYPAVYYRNGSVVRFKTGNQGGASLASATIDVVLIDEPLDQRIFEELKKRVLRRNGDILLTLTPINGPTDYLRELADAGQISDHHYALRPEYLIPVGALEPLCLEDGTPMDDQWIAQVRAETLALEVPVIVDGEWETKVEGRVFVAFDARRSGGAHVTTSLPDEDLVVCLGIDHGAKDFKQVAMLVGVDLAGEHPRVHVLDEYVGEGLTTPEQDADGILGMLKRWGWSWQDVNVVFGDKPYDAGASRGRVGRKSNRELEAALARQLGIGRRVLQPTIRQAKTGPGGGRGSIDRGCSWLHRAMLRKGCFTVQARCERLIGALERWDYTDSDEKDPIDALRYATWKFAMKGSANARDGRNPSIYVY